MFFEERQTTPPPIRRNLVLEFGTTDENGNYTSYTTGAFKAVRAVAKDMAPGQSAVLTHNTFLLLAALKQPSVFQSRS